MLDAPFASPDDVAAGWRTLTAAELTRAMGLLDAAATWIRSKRPGIAADDPQARFVSTEVVRAALATGRWEGHASYSETVGGVSRSGTLVPAGAAGSVFFTDFHKELLGIPTAATPVGQFGDVAS